MIRYVLPLLLALQLAPLAHADDGLDALQLDPSCTAMANDPKSQCFIHTSTGRVISLNTYNSGKGGNGADGYCIVTTYF